MSGAIFLPFSHLARTDAMFFMASRVYVPASAVVLVAAMEAGASRGILLAQRFTARYEHVGPAVKAAAFLMVVASSIDLGYVPSHLRVAPLAGRAVPVERRAPTSGGPASGGPALGASAAASPAHQEGPPRRAREEAAEGAEQQAVGGLEAWPVDLAFEDTELVAEGEDLDLERGLGLPAEGEQIEQGADDGVNEAQDHDRMNNSNRIDE